ncbi:BatD family protein [Luteolibacter marinus]|uniref:BatD family protein n=1 Tax=Luteolibacter marinus TaxID=2776705 RepID=UPI001868875D|nr:BatD family protein [Luteolibacter marinus]
MRAEIAEAWTGQRVPFHIELRSTGTFAGTASFDLPQLPGTLIVKTGSPVVSSEDVGEVSYFIQTHTFSLFSQQDGILEVPPITVRFSARNGFTGPAHEIDAATPAWQVTLKRPPGTDPATFLVTTRSLGITESWDPAPGEAKVGDVFKRTIVQRSPDLSGIALAPAPATAPDGFRVYPPAVEVNDDFQRGNFLGERRETLTYLVQQSGALELPALTYTWWNPERQSLESKTLPAVSLVVAAPPPVPDVATGPGLRTWLPALAALIAVATLVWQRQRIRDFIQECRKKLNPPDRVAARHLLRACRRNDAPAAARAWAAWQSASPPAFTANPELRSAVLDLQRQLFGQPEGTPWHGRILAAAFTASLKAPAHDAPRASPLPPLNP